MSQETILPTGNEFFPPDLGDLVVTLPTEESELKKTASFIQEYTEKKIGQDAAGKDIDKDICELIPDYPYAVFNLKIGNEIVGAGNVEVVKIKEVVYLRKAREMGFDRSKLKGEQVGMLYYMAAKEYKEYDDIGILANVCFVGDLLARDMADSEKYIATFTTARDIEVSAAKKAGYWVYIPQKYCELHSRNPKYNGPITDLRWMTKDTNHLKKQPKWLQEVALYAAMQRTDYRQQIEKNFKKACLALN